MSPTDLAATSSTAQLVRRRWPALVLIIAAVGFGVYDTRQFLRGMDTAKPTLKRWLPFAAEIGRDDQLYARHPDYLYPPCFLVLMKPLTWVSPTTAAVLWQLMKYACIGAIFTLSWRLLNPGRAAVVWVIVVAAVVTARFVISDLRHGNINIIIAFLVVTAAFLLARRCPFAAGIIVAVATAIKITPGLFITYLLYKRAWRALLGAGIGLVVMLEVVPLAVMPASLNHRLLHDWRRHVVSGYIATGEIYSPWMNQSVAALTNRLFARQEPAPGEPRIAIIRLPDSSIRLLQYAIAAALLIGLAVSCRGRLPESPMALAVEWSLVSIVALALSGYTWTGHFCWLVLPYFVLLTYLDQTRPRFRDRTVTLLTAVSVALGCLTGDNLGRAGREYATALGSLLFASFVAGAALAVVRECLRRPTSALSPSLDGWRAFLTLLIRYSVIHCSVTPRG